MDPYWECRVVKKAGQEKIVIFLCALELQCAVAEVFVKSLLEEELLVANVPWVGLAQVVLFRTVRLGEMVLFAMEEELVWEQEEVENLSVFVILVGWGTVVLFRIVLGIVLRTWVKGVV